MQTEAFTHRSLYAQMCSHTGAFTEVRGCTKIQINKYIYIYIYIGGHEDKTGMDGNSMLLKGVCDPENLLAHLCVKVADEIINVKSQQTV